jgi:2-polyprenyl-3-methyl-5-hydroxy-6-metoxy-1,4-benzoquinol methylase
MAVFPEAEAPADATGAAGVSAAAPASASCWVTLVDGRACDLAQLTRRELLRLQFAQEKAFARLFVACPKRSAERREAIRRGYDTVTTIYAAANGRLGQPTVMGCDARYERLVLKLLQRQREAGLPAALFEIGCGCGTLLARVHQRGFLVGGIEVSEVMHRQALAALRFARHNLLLGDLLDQDPAPLAGRYTLVYWNDVFEHVPPDEIDDYLRFLRAMLAPGGTLLTITPNWHVRPSDVTGEFGPPRTVAQGVHLKEYTLREVTSLLKKAGFCRVATPLCVTRRRIVLAGSGLAKAKRTLEPALEWLPFRLARLLVRAGGLSCTLAQ